jgi:hypothetical protein
VISAVRIFLPFALFACAALVGCAESAPSSARADAAANTASASRPAAPADASSNNAAAKEELPSGQPSEGVIQDLTFDDLKFEMEKTEPFERSMLTPEIEALVGQKIRIRGYIRPTPFQKGITQFVLVRDNLECCFGQGAWLYDCVMVEMQGDASTDYTIRPVAVEGVFDVQEFVGPDGKHLAIYHLDGERVE